MEPLDVRSLVLYDEDRSPTVGVGNGDPISSGWQRVARECRARFFQFIYLFLHSFIHSLIHKIACSGDQCWLLDKGRASGGSCWMDG